MSASGYTRLSQDEFYDKVRKRTADKWRKTYISNPTKEEEEEARKVAERLRSKPESPYSVTNVIWLMVSIGVFYLTDFAAVILFHHAVNRLWLYAGAISLSISATCFIYCVIWLSMIKKIRSDRWELHNPYVIPVATVGMVIGFSLLCAGLWPVWGVLTLPIVGIQIYGLVIMVALIPDGIGL